MVRSFKIYESFIEFFKGDEVEVVDIANSNDKPFLGMIGKITNHDSWSDVYGVIFDKKMPGTHDDIGRDPSGRTRNFYKHCLKSVLSDEELEKIEKERKLKKEKYKHVDPFEEEIW